MLHTSNVGPYLKIVCHEKNFILFKMILSKFPFIIHVYQDLILVRIDNDITSLRCNAGGYNRLNTDWTKNQTQLKCLPGNTFEDIEWPTCMGSKYPPYC